MVEEILVEEKKDEPEPKPMYKPQLPYPQRFKKKALDEQFSKFLDIFKMIHINIIFADVSEQMSNYAKFIKDVMSKKIRLQENELANRSITYPRGIVEVVLVKFDKFIFPADFVILGMDEDEEAPLIFGRPFLATARELIDVHKGELNLRVGGEAVIFNIYHAMRGPSEELMSRWRDAWLRMRKLIKKRIGNFVNKRLS
ncbi:uncharacterized protein [Henckelia pumila]|uniref:uncharacterized protein n=1 Tax=Henckelia pumila TaxID=405737 RepID=UPI003C6E33C4